MLPAIQQWISICCFSLLLAGCTAPSLQFISAAEQHGFSHELRQGLNYPHRLFFNALAQQSHSYDELHVYLDGDGTPWETANSPAKDPAARNPLILELLSKDNKPSILLGRPCYYGVQNTLSCRPSVWTSHRYSPEVIASLVFVLQDFLKKKSSNRLVFIGYSGGGALATLIAGAFMQTDMIITIAANLDTRLWCEYHHYQPLNESLNPIESAKIPNNIKQFHLTGMQDENVPPTIAQNFSNRFANSSYLIINDYNHNCCWEDMWANYLEQITRANPNQPSQNLNLD